eukprot:gene2582-biopygen6057
MPRDKARALEAEHGSAGGGFPCGTCQQPCTTKANELIEVTFAVGKTAATVPLCGCEEGPATVHCGKCGLNFCDDCDAAGHSKGAKKAHVRIPINKEHLSAGGGGEGAGGKALMCPIHRDYPLTFFCKHDGCGTTICAMCAAKEHSTHDYVDIAEASGTTRQALEKVVARAALALVEVSEGVAAVNERRKEVEQSAKETHAEVQRAYKQAQAGLISDMKTTQAAALTEGGRKEGVLVNQRDALASVKGRLESGLDLAHRVQEGASEVQLLQIQRLLVDGLTAATSHGISLQPVCGPSVMFVKSPAWMALNEKVPALGAISGSDTNPAACTAEGGGLKEAGVGNAVGFVVTAVNFEGRKRENGDDGVALTVVFVGGGGGDAAGAGGGDGGGGGCGGGGGVGAAGNTVTSVVDHKDGTYTCKYVIPEGSPEGVCQLAVRILGQHIHGSPFAVHVSAGKQFAHTGAFDGNGVLHWIGSGCGTKEYTNPHGKPGGVVAKMSSVYNNYGCTPSRFVEHAPLNQDNYTEDTANSWMSVDLGEGRHLAPDYYCLRHGCSGGNDRLRHWRLEGSNDDSTWTLLKTHANDQALPEQKYSTASWPIEAAADGASYRYFRIFQTGKDSSGDNYLICAGIELYGFLR